MRRGTRFAYCSRTRVLPLSELARVLAPNPALTTRIERDVLIVTVHDSLTGNDADVTVSIDDGGHVRSQAEELASALDAGTHAIDPVVPRPDTSALRQADTRYEMTWDLRYSDETFNTLMWLTEPMVHACEAIVYDATSRRFV